jgi:hypothetical protein
MLVEQFIEAFFDRWPDYPPDEVRKEWERDLTEAWDRTYPAIRKQERQRVREALLGRSALEAAMQAWIKGLSQAEQIPYGPRLHRAIEAALDTLGESDGSQ